MNLQLEFPFDSPYQSGNSHGFVANHLSGAAWSYSRRSLLDQCPRRYYYEYYGSNSRTTPNAPQKDKLRFLKELTNRHERVGQIMHLVIATSLKKMKSGETWTIDRMCDWACSIFGRDIAYSRDFQRQHKNGQNESYPPKLLTEFYYGDLSANDLCADSQERMTSAIEAFAMQSDYDTFREAGSRADTLIEYPISVDLGLPCKIEGRIDLAFPHTNGAKIVDWKLGSMASESESLQLVTYALWAQGFFGIKSNEIEICMAYLGSRQLTTNRLMQDTISRGRARILQDIESMSFLDKYGRAGTFEAFSPCGQTAICSLCPFREVCSPAEV